MADGDERPQYQHGVGTIGGSQFHWGSGTPGKYWSIPYGDYPITPNAPTGEWAHQVGAIPIANNVIPDPQLGRNRIGIMIHSGSADSLDQLYTQGCFKVDPQDWPRVRTEILAEADKGPLYLHVAPGGVAAFTNTKTLSQAGDETPAATANATANTTAATASAGAPPSRPATGAIPDNRQVFFNALTKAGLSPQQALGGLWGMGGESGPTLNTGAYNPNDPGGSVGAGQWQGPRRAALEAYAAKTGKNVTDPQTQADFTVSELTDPKSPTYQPGVFAALQAAKTPEDAARIWTGQYERPKVDNSSQRIAAGAQVGSLDAKGNFVLGTGGGAAPTAVASGQPAGGAIGTTINSLTGTSDNPSPFMQGASELEKGLAGQAPGQGQDQGAPQVRPVSIAQPPPPHMPSPQYGQQLYGTTLNSMQTPLNWGTGQPNITGRGPASPYASQATQGGMPVMAGTPMAAGVPQGATLEQFQQMQQQAQQQALMQQYGVAGGLGGLGGMNYGGYGYG